MHYIRFLKTPKTHVDRGSVLLKAVVTVTTDLGETFYPKQLDLVVTLRSTPDVDDGEIFIRRKIQWQAGARSVPISLDVSQQDIEWPACMHVTTRNARSNGFLPPLVDVWSGPLNPTKGKFDSGRRVERRFSTLSERTVSLLEDAGDSIARHLWDGSQALAQYIDRTVCLQDIDTIPALEDLLTTATYRRLNIIELGCGCGTVGIAIAQTIPDCDVLLTDLPEVTELVAANIARLQPAMSARIDFKALDWLEPLSGALQTRKNDLILVSECTYNTDTLEPLVKMLTALVSRSPKAVVVVSTKTRHESEKAFFGLMKQADFADEGHMRLPLPGEPGTGYADWAQDVGLHVFRGKDHKRMSSRHSSSESVERSTGETVSQPKTEGRVRFANQHDSALA